MQGVNVNDDASLESEADVMGRKAVQRRRINSTIPNNKTIQRDQTYTIERIGFFRGLTSTHLTTDAQKISRRYAAKALMVRDAYYLYIMAGSPSPPHAFPTLTPLILNAINTTPVNDLSNGAAGILGQNEQLILVSHGSRPMSILGNTINSIFGNLISYDKSTKRTY